MTPRPLTDAERAEGRALLAEYRRRAKDKSDDSTAPGVHFAWDRAQVWLDGYLRNHAEALLDAADELARLKAGVADRDHTTHFDDCGCRSARYEAEVARLKAKIAAVEPVARAAVAQRYCCGYHVELDCVRKKLHPAVDALPPDVLAELWKEE